ncbi:hypothetical protein AB0G02_01995 [Actinosynnema sp. NPDC023658]|uniref:hypothetical protein n=1 Tax=Actinosynnema sp. NPDC023658 TaxID=3155465 RepID=UPI0034114A6F
MRAFRLISAIAITIAGLLSFSSPASAGTLTVYSAQHVNTGDIAYYDNSSNVLTACDYSAANGTARAVLVVINGSTKEVYDSNGAQSGCGSVGPLNVDNSKRAYLYICANDSGSTCYRRVEDFPV